ncbi:MAG: hypothetical protein HY473_02715 [Candidatus Sungbacteria bacterium]|uniref:Phosphoenolpyruvate synthase n=1 Tax=Candidatus Sungiibacteriota bacterium TaxID=2750080 RepID=A0A933DTK0_9BACT|nr:hypothetical protein [Candidatus Sungbacteria bacterium]
MSRIIDFERLGDADLSAVPGKIARLYHKHVAGLPVPHRGFVIPPLVVADILKNTRDVAALAPDQFPAGVRRELCEAYRAWRFEQEGVRVAVRAALNVEDAPKAAYPGGSESPTNVLGENAFLAAVAECVSVSCNGRMHTYLTRHSIHTEPELHILVHDMARSDAFAIVFTRNPFGHRNEVVVQATFGGGEPLTSGTETGDFYELDRSGRLLRATVAEKRMMSTPEGMVPVPRELARRRVFSNPQLAELVAFALRVEEHEGGEPQDCEIAVQLPEGGIHPVLVQNRPVTATADKATFIRRLLIADAERKSTAALERLQEHGIRVPRTIYSDQNVVELLTRNPSRMAFGMFTLIFAHGEGGIRAGRNRMGYDIGPELDSGFFELIAGQPRCSIVHDAFTYRISGIPLSDYVRGFVLPYLEAIQRDPKLANYPEVVLYDQRPSLETLTSRFGERKARQYFEHYRVFFEGIRRLEQTFAREYRTLHTPEWREFISMFHLEDVGEFTAERLMEECHELLEYLRTRMCVWFVIAARLGFFAYARLRKRLEERYDAPEASRLLDALTAGLQDDPTLEFNLALARVRDGAVSVDWVLSQYGHLGFNELEIAGPRYRERPEIITEMAHRLRSTPQTEFAARVSECRRIQDGLAITVGDGWSEWEEDITAARTYLALRETVKFHYLMFYEAIRERLLAVEQKFRWERGLVFFLDPREISMLLNHPERAHELARRRRDEHHRAREFTVPKVMFSDEPHRIDSAEFLLPEGTVELSGIGGSPFVAEGPVVIVHDPNDPEEVARVHEGCILVAPSADPAWAPIVCALGKTGGLITEVGGPLAHGAIICREMGNAAVVDVPDATRIIRDGEIVRIDGRDPQNGRVYLLER